MSRKTFYGWRNTNSDFAEAIREAMENREERLRLMARQAMKKKLGGYKLVETKTVYTLNKDAEDASQLSVKEYVVKDKYCVPETSAIALTLSDRVGKGKRALGKEGGYPLSIVVSSEKVKNDLELVRSNLGSDNGETNFT